MPNRPIVNGPGANTTTDCAQLRADMKITKSWSRITVVPLSPPPTPHVRQDLADGLAAASETLSELYANFARYCIGAPVGRKQFEIGASQTR